MTRNGLQAGFRGLVAIAYSWQGTNGARLPNWRCLQTTLKAEFKTHLLLSEMLVPMAQSPVLIQTRI